MRISIKILLISAIVFLIVIFGGKYFYIDYNYGIRVNNNLNYYIKYTGLNDARDFSFDNDENYYIAFKNRVQIIKKNGDSFNLFKDNKLNITSIEYKDGNIYYASDTRVLRYNIKTKKIVEIISDIPNFGDYNQSLIRICQNKLYITSGAATNSGVVGKDNLWVKQSPLNCDVSPFNITIRGKNFGSEKTGAFVPYKTKNFNGQLITGHFPGNACIIEFDLKTGSSSTYAWGIRNIKGMDINSVGKIISSVGGMEDRGLRPVKGDTDYIYEIKKGMWYGWPDYTGGDPINSPRFKGKNNQGISFILDKHPNTNPPGPIYQYEHLNALGSLCIDRDGMIGPKDAVYFYNTINNLVAGMNDDKTITSYIQFDSKSKIISIKFSNDGMILLDSSKGVLYTIKQKGSVS